MERQTEFDDFPLSGPYEPGPADNISRTDFPGINGPELGGHNPFGLPWVGQQPTSTRLQRPCVLGCRTALPAIAAASRHARLDADEQVRRAGSDTEAAVEAAAAVLGA
ncbi:hypothetical protein [Streptomyces sp. NPDC097610]|uniref:hypothetical protein n=1 Tax=Streptomyces sp. NPDC097610 TaxID=3157227 RepID=UPI003322F0EC